MKWIGKIYQHLWLRKVPFGLFSWRFLLPNQPGVIRLHKNIVMKFYPKIPRAFWLFIVIIVGLRWMLFYAPYYSYKITRHRAKVVEGETGLSQWQQYRKVLVFSLGHGLAPAEWYNYRLYQLEDSQYWWNYIYSQEAQAFHNYRNDGRASNREHKILLGDKWAFEQWCVKKNIPVVKTLKFCQKRDKQFSQHLLQLCKKHGRLFAKRRHGNQAHGAFIASLDQGKLIICPFGVIKSTLSTNGYESELNSLIAEENYLLQPLYQATHVLQNDNAPEYATSLRVISCFDRGKISLDCAYLEYPLVTQATQKISEWLPIPVNIENGYVQFDHQWLRQHPSEKVQKYLHQFEALIIIPNWQTLVKTVKTAHSELSGLYSIAWDFIPTEQGAMLLEGNSGWRVSTPQYLTEPFLGKAIPT